MFLLVECGDAFVITPSHTGMVEAAIECQPTYDPYLEQLSILHRQRDGTQQQAGPQHGDTRLPSP